MAVRVLARLAASILVAKRAQPGARGRRRRTASALAGVDGISSHAVNEPHRGW